MSSRWLLHLWNRNQLQTITHNHCQNQIIDLYQNKIRSTHNPKNHQKKKKKKTHEAKWSHHSGLFRCVCETKREREDNKPSETLVMGSLGEIEESERWKLRLGGLAMDLRLVVVMVVCVWVFESVGFFKFMVIVCI